MKDHLEDFIRQNKAAFDDKEPADKSWTLISSRLFVNTSFSLWNSVNVWRAAAVILLGACIYLAVPKLQDRKERALAMSEFKDVESFYTKEIADKVELIEDFRGAEAGLNGFTNDFKQLNAMYQVLKEEMKLHPSQKVKDALVLNLLVQIDLLNQQLHKIEEGEEIDSNETVTNNI